MRPVPDPAAADGFGLAAPPGYSIARQVMLANKNFPATANSSIDLVTANFLVSRLDPIHFACRATILGGTGDGRCALALCGGSGGGFVADSLIEARDTGTIPANGRLSVDLVGWFNPTATGAAAVTLKLYRPGASAGALTVLGDFDESETVGLFTELFTDTPTQIELLFSN
jgi:hypothetical protein